MRNNNTLKLILTALFLALTYVLPFLTGQIPEIGSMLCPMHIPVLLCGFICGWHSALVLGAIAPIFRSLIAGMPSLFPTALCMAFELAAYGAVSGIMYKILPKKKIYIYCSLIISMVAGRIVWGLAMLISMNVSGGSFGISAFIAGAVTNALPGIIFQIVLVPAIVMLLESAKLPLLVNKNNVDNDLN